MIGRLQGRLAGKAPPQVLIDVQGVGYEVDVPMSTFCALPALGEPVSLLTHFVVREDAQVLFGFLGGDDLAASRHRQCEIDDQRSGVAWQWRGEGQRIRA